MWRGVAVRESFLDGVIPPMAKEVDERSSELEGEASRGTFGFASIEVEDTDVEEVTEFAIDNLLPGWYFHLVGPEKMRVIFKDKVFEFTPDDKDTVGNVVSYGLAEGIHTDQLNPEGIVGLFDKPFG